jgi:hypothetical protein
MRETFAIILFLTLFCASSIALGYVIGSSNLGIMGYPDFSSSRMKPIKPYSRDSYSMDRYYHDVKIHVEEADRYIEAANNDIQRIQEAAEKARNEAREAIREHNNFVKFGY